MRAPYIIKGKTGEKNLSLQGRGRRAAAGEGVMRVRAKNLRTLQTDAEKKLWQALRNRQFGFKFRRQQPMAHYIADFVCFEQKLIVEIDGGQHADAAAYDTTRKQFFEAQGYRVLRFWNNEVLGNVEGVLQHVASVITPHPNPLPQGDREQSAAPILPPLPVEGWNDGVTP
jgi:very-short-patch-repair endonuclease